jgi:hypothetical protein
VPGSCASLPTRPNSHLAVHEDHRVPTVRYRVNGLQSIGYEIGVNAEIIKLQLEQTLQPRVIFHDEYRCIRLRSRSCGDGDRFLDFDEDAHDGVEERRLAQRFTHRVIGSDIDDVRRRFSPRPRDREFEFGTADMIGVGDDKPRLLAVRPDSLSEIGGVMSAPAAHAPRNHVTLDDIGEGIV